MEAKKIGLQAPITMGGGDGDGDIAIPSVMISATDGN